MRNDDASSRRDFLKLAGAGAAAALCVGGRTTSLAEEVASKRQRPFQLALASYTLRKFDLDKTLQMTRRVGLPAICLKSFHLPLDATPEQIAAAAAKTKDAGLVLYGAGVISMQDEKQIDQAFAYAKAAGMIRIMAAPTAKVLPIIERKVQQFDIQVCIHNHGPGDRNFPTPDLIYEKIQGLDRRIGICHDVGHTVRYGADAIAMTEKYAERIYDVHIKDVTAASPKGECIACGRGVIDLPRLLRTLAKVRFSGYLAFEYEVDADDPLPGLAESVGYINGVMDTL